MVALEETGEVPLALFDTVLEPCRMLLREHEAADHALEAIRRLTGSYAPSPAADAPTRALYAALAAYDQALVMHMHIEGNVLFPRAQQLEAKARRPAARRPRR